MIRIFKIKLQLAGSYFNVLSVHQDIIQIQKDQVVNYVIKRKLLKMKVQLNVIIVQLVLNQMNIKQVVLVVILEDIQIMIQNIGVNIIQMERIQMMIQQIVLIVQKDMNHHIIEINVLIVFQDHFLLMIFQFVNFVHLIHIQMYMLQLNVFHVQQIQQQMVKLVKHLVNVQKVVLVVLLVDQEIIRQMNIVHHVFQDIHYKMENVQFVKMVIIQVVVIPFVMHAQQILGHIMVKKNV